MTAVTTTDTPTSWRTDTVPESSRGERPASFDVGDFAIPSGREEEWRFTPLERLRGLHDGTAARSSFAGGLLVEVDASADVSVEQVARGDSRLGTAGTPGDRIAAQAWACFEDATVITIPRELDSERATIVTLTGKGGSEAVFGHVLIEAKQHSRATVVLDHRGSATYADNVELLVRDGADLTVVSVQDWNDDAVHVSSHHALLHRDARLKTVVVSLGGDLVRISPSATFAASGGDVEMLGLCFADAGQHLEHRLFVDHVMPHCRSNVVYKGALQGRDAHTVWIGDVLIRASAEGTDTYEVNRNLLLTDGARADSVPNLEIETGEITGAGHASATGRFDDEQLFYLQSRGIPEAEARRLVVRGFFADVIAQVGVPEMQERLRAAIEAELEAVVAT